MGCERCYRGGGFRGQGIAARQSQGRFSKTCSPRTDDRAVGCVVDEGGDGSLPGLRETRSLQRTKLQRLPKNDIQFWLSHELSDQSGPLGWHSDGVLGSAIPVACGLPRCGASQKTVQRDPEDVVGDKSNFPFRICRESRDLTSPACSRVLRLPPRLLRFGNCRERTQTI